MSAGIERPQDFWARNESLVAEDSAQVLSWIHLRQVMLAWGYPAGTFAMSSSFSPSLLALVISCLDAKAGDLNCWVSILFPIPLPFDETA